jgi:hypothetical protein
MKDTKQIYSVALVRGELSIRSIRTKVLTLKNISIITRDTIRVILDSFNIQDYYCIYSWVLGNIR